MAAATLARYDALSRPTVKAMKRRSKASSKSAKARPNKSSKLLRRARQRPLAKSGSAPSAPEPEVAQLKQDLHIASEQQAATSEALRIIASSPSELQPVFDALLANAARRATVPSGFTRMMVRCE